MFALVRLVADVKSPLRVGLALHVALLCTCRPLLADEPEPAESQFISTHTSCDERISVDIPAGSLMAALRRFRN